MFRLRRYSESTRPEKSRIILTTRSGEQVDLRIGYVSRAVGRVDLLLEATPGVSIRRAEDLEAALAAGE